MKTEALAWAFGQLTPSPESKLLLVLLADSADPDGLVHSPDLNRLATYCCTDALGLQCALAEPLLNRHGKQAMGWHLPARAAHGLRTYGIAEASMKDQHTHTD